MMKNLMTDNLVHAKIEYPRQFITNGSTLDQYGLYAVNVGACDGATNYLSLYDQFRINKVVFKFTPASGEVINKPFDDTTTPGSAVRNPIFATCIDFDSESVGAEKHR